MYRFTLQPYKNRSSRTVCPNCGDKGSFKLYIDSEGEIQFPAHVGRCDREVKCGYHFTPKQYFEEVAKDGNSDFKEQKQPEIIVEPSFLPAGIADRKRGESNFLRYLVGLFGFEIATQIANDYKLGSSTAIENGVIFWQISDKGTHAGKVMGFDTNGKRLKTGISINWVHKLMKLENFNLSQTLFGMHLIYGNELTINIVESESTALFMACYNILNNRNSGLWLATGGSNGARWYSQEIFSAFGKIRKIIIHPDKGKFEEWTEKVKAHKMNGFNIIVTDYIERNALNDNDDYRDIIQIKKKNESEMQYITFEAEELGINYVIERLLAIGYTIKRAIRQIDKWIVDGLCELDFKNELLYIL